MTPLSLPAAIVAAKAFVALSGDRRWSARMAEIQDLAASGPRAGQAIRQRHAVELAIDRLRQPNRRLPGQAELRLAAIAGKTAELANRLRPTGRGRLEAALADALRQDASLISLFHLVRTAALQESRGFDVRFSGLEEGTPFDLLLRKDRTEAELASDVVSAEDGRGVHRGAWFRLADRVDPDLQIWLAAHPGRYLLKMTLSNGLRLSDTASGDAAPLAALHRRINALLHARVRHDHDEAIVLRLDPLLLAGSQSDETGLMSSLRREFGPEAHLSVTTAGGGVFVMAARAGQENEIAVSIRKRLAALAPARLSGTRPGILSVFVEDTDRAEWRGLRERLELEGETRQFLTNPEARTVVERARRLLRL